MIDLETVIVRHMDSCVIRDAVVLQEGSKGITGEKYQPIVEARGRKFQMDKLRKKGLAVDLDTLEIVMLVLEGV